MSLRFRAPADSLPTAFGAARKVDLTLQSDPRYECDAGHPELPKLGLILAVEDPEGPPMHRAAAIAILIGLPLTAAMADVYRSVDSQGHVQYSDTPTPGSQLVHMNNQRSPIRTEASDTATPGSTATSKPPALTQTSTSIHDQLEQEAAERAVQNDLAQTRADQCKKATDAYNASVQARRIFKTGPNGERQFLTDDEADKQRLSNKVAMDEACKGQ
jgi:galactitol-specific phosphotransferase system IIB component